MNRAERKAFRSQMWAFRRDPGSLTTEEQQALEALFEGIPPLKELYQVRLRFKEIFDTAPDRTTAARWLRGYPESYAALLFGYLKGDGFHASSGASLLNIPPMALILTQASLDSGNHS